MHGEQGLGDEIMFDIKQEAKQVIWGCRPPLVRLLANSHPQIDVVPHHVVVGPADMSNRKIDYQIPIGSLGRWRRKEMVDFQGTKVLLQPDKDQVAMFNQRLAKTIGADKKYRIGIMWGANPSLEITWARRRSVQKSIPAESFRPLSSYCDRVQFVSLQNMDAAMEASNIPELNIIDFHRDLLDFADTAALVQNMDLVISVDTSVAHLAGALGKPVWLLLMNRADWRWGRGGNKSVWYESARLFRQPHQGDWDSVICDLSADIGEWLENQP